MQFKTTTSIVLMAALMALQAQAAPVIPDSGTTTIMANNPPAPTTATLTPAAGAGATLAPVPDVRDPTKPMPWDTNIGANANAKTMTNPSQDVTSPYATPEEGDQNKWGGSWCSSWCPWNWNCGWSWPWWNNWWC